MNGSSSRSNPRFSLNGRLIVTTCWMIFSYIIFRLSSIFLGKPRNCYLNNNESYAHPVRHCRPCLHVIMCSLLCHECFRCNNEDNRECKGNLKQPYLNAVSYFLTDNFYCSWIGPIENSQHIAKASHFPPPIALFHWDKRFSHTCMSSFMW